MLRLNIEAVINQIFWTGNFFGEFALTEQLLSLVGFMGSYENQRKRVENFIKEKALTSDSYCQRHVQGFDCYIFKTATFMAFLMSTSTVVSSTCLPYYFVIFRDAQGMYMSAMKARILQTQQYQQYGIQQNDQLRYMNVRRIRDLLTTTTEMPGAYSTDSTNLQIESTNPNVIEIGQAENVALASGNENKENENPIDNTELYAQNDQTEVTVAINGRYTNEMKQLNEGTEEIEGEKEDVPVVLFTTESYLNEMDIDQDQMETVVDRNENNIQKETTDIVDDIDKLRPPYTPIASASVSSIPPNEQNMLHNDKEMQQNNKDDDHHDDYDHYSDTTEVFDPTPFTRIFKEETVMTDNTDERNDDDRHSVTTIIFDPRELSVCKEETTSDSIKHCHYCKQYPCIDVSVSRTHVVVGSIAAFIPHMC